MWLSSGGFPFVQWQVCWAIENLETTSMSIAVCPSLWSIKPRPLSLDRSRLAAGTGWGWIASRELVMSERSR